MFVFLVGFVVLLYAKQDIGKSIEYLEKYIAKVQETVDKSGNAEAVDLLNKAKESTQKAGDLANSDDKKGAWKEIHKAHRYVSKAYHLARGPKKFKGKKGPKDPAEMIARKIERMEKYIESATKIVEESGIEKANIELALGIELFKKAKGLYTDGKTEEAMDALKQASKSIHSAIRIAKQLNIIERMIMQLEKTIEKIQQTVNNSENQEAKDLLADGVVQLEKGKALFQNGEMDQAKKELKNASKSIYKAIRMVKSDKKNPKKNHFKKMEKWIERVTKQLEKAKENVDSYNSEEAKVKIAEAAEHLNKATELTSQDKDKEAASELKAASKLIHEAYMIVKLPEKVEKWIEQLDKRVEKVKGFVEESTDPKAKEVFNKGVALLANAKELQSTGKSKEAIAELKKASKQINKAMRIAKPKMKRPNRVNR